MGKKPPLTEKQWEEKKRLSKEGKKKHMAEWRKNNRELLRARSKKYRENNKEKLKKYQIKYQKEHQEELKKYRDEYYAREDVIKRRRDYKKKLRKAYSKPTELTIS